MPLSAALLSALAWSTQHLGLAVTSSIVSDHPFTFARRMFTLGHVSRGRVAWNVVMSSTANTWRNCGYDDLVAHDERYAIAEGYVDVTYQLWEGSWDDDAEPADKAGWYADLGGYGMICPAVARRAGSAFSKKAPEAVGTSPAQVRPGPA